MSRNQSFNKDHGPSLFTIGNSADYSATPVATNRGWERVWLVEGTSNVTGTAIVGAGSNFTKILSVGSRVYISGQVRTIASITDDTHATIDSALASNVTGVTIKKLVEVIAAIGSLDTQYADAIVIPTFTLAATSSNLVTDDTLILTVTASEPVSIVGIPAIGVTLNSGKVYAQYNSLVSTPTSLIFEYTVKSNDLDPNGIVIDNIITLDLGEQVADILSSGVEPIASSNLTFTVPSVTITVND